MKLARSASSGYAMAALLVALSVMAVLLSVALPAWSHMIRREKEEELIFRGNQYARALARYQRTRPGAAPTSIDELIKDRLLRKKFKDPMSPNKDGEFQLLYLNLERSPSAGAAAPTASLGTKPTGGIRGVASKNTGQSIRVLNGKTRYNEWEFVATEMSSQPGGPAGGRGGRGAGSRGRGDGRGDAGARGGYMTSDELAPGPMRGRGPGPGR